MCLVVDGTYLTVTLTISTKLSQYIEYDVTESNSYPECSVGNGNSNMI